MSTQCITHGRFLYASKSITDNMRSLVVETELTHTLSDSPDKNTGRQDCKTFQATTPPDNTDVPEDMVSNR